MSLDPLALSAHSLVILVSVFVIAVGSRWVVDSSSRIAKRLGVSELVMGLTVVAVGTSAPEFTVTLLSALKDQGNISVGNIVGSNIFNLGFILGGCALVRAIPTGRVLLLRDCAVLAAATFMLLILVGWDLELDRMDGVMLLVVLAFYVGYLFKQRQAIPGTEERLQTLAAESERGGGPSRDALWLALGFALIIAGANLLIGSATSIARAFGLSEWVIAVTIVAAGTSTPEFATSLAGVVRGHYTLSAGNVIGSDLFNLLGVLGLAGLIRPVDVDPQSRVSLLAVSGMVLLVMVLMRSGWRISRGEGLLLVAVSMGRWAFDFSVHAP